MSYISLCKEFRPIGGLLPPIVQQVTLLESHWTFKSGMTVGYRNLAQGRLRRLCTKTGRTSEMSVTTHGTEIQQPYGLTSKDA